MEVSPAISSTLRLVSLLECRPTSLVRAAPGWVLLAKTLRPPTTWTSLLLSYSLGALELLLVWCVTSDLFALGGRTRGIKPWKTAPKIIQVLKPLLHGKVAVRGGMVHIYTSNYHFLEVLFMQRRKRWEEKYCPVTDSELVNCYS